MNSQPVLLVLAIAVGAGIALQALVNARLQTYTQSSLVAALISFVVGTLAISVFVLLQRPSVRLETLATAPWWAWSGGVFGAIYIFSFVVLIPRMSPVVLFGANILGQMVFLVAAEHFGFLTADKTPLNLSRVLGVALI